MRRYAYIACCASALTLVAGPSAMALSEGQKLRRVEQDNRDIRRDARDIRQDDTAIGHDEKALSGERAARNYDLRREERAIEHGNLGAAEAWDQRRRREQKRVNAARRDISKDGRDLANDKVDLIKDIERRNRDASKL